MSMRGFIEMDFSFGGASSSETIWQQIEEGEVVGYFKADGTPVELPEIYEMRVASSDILPSIPIGDSA